MRKLQFCLAISVLLLVSSLNAIAQVQNGQFTGVVTDPSGAALANASVTVTNTATNFAVAATTNQTGIYVVKELPPGPYKITVEVSGFRTATNFGLTLNAGTISRVDFKMQLGATKEIVEVTGEPATVNTEDSKLSTTVSSTQIDNLPLNGRNVYDLMQMAPGAVNVAGVDFENGHNTVVNGVRENFNGFLINGESNKDISGGQNTVPIQDTVQEFQQLTLNMSAQYGSSAGSINNLVTKSGTNSYHGSVWEYVRNDDFDANEYFLNQQGAARPPLHFNQFGGTVGGPIIKDKLFFFGSYQGDRFTETGVPELITVESPQWRQAVEAGNPGSVAALLYKNFAPSIVGSPSGTTLDSFTGGNYYPYICSSSGIAAKVIPILGVTAADITNQPAGCGLTAPVTGTMSRSAPFEYTSAAIFGSQTQSLGNLFNGNEAMGRIDFDPSASNRFFAEMDWHHQTDQFGGNNCNSNCTRGFTNPNNDYFPNAQFNWVHTFSPTVLNELKVGYTQNNTQINTNVPGVPDIGFEDGVTGFGSYNGYPQFFKDHEYSYGDMVSISHGNHNFKVGGDLRRNLENSEFNVARPSYGFQDEIFFAGDLPNYEVAGVNPDFCATGAPCSTLNPNPQPALASNFRHWRNWEVGAYVQDDWKTTRRLTLNLGLRWDFYQRHNELNDLVTTFKLGPTGASLPQQVASANAPLGSPGCDPATIIPNTQVLAGVCGPGGFATASSLGPNQYHDFGPRVGFAYDVFGDGKTSFRGGFGISYEGTLYNPLSNSRWNPPYYSFNLTGPAVDVPQGIPVYGPTTCSTTSCAPSGATPRFTGPATNPGQGVGAQAVGNLTGWFAGNPDTAYLTGIVLPQGVKDPYVYNDFISLQREIVPKLTLELDYVGTVGHRLFRSQQINRQVGAQLPYDSATGVAACVTNNLGEHVCGLPGGLPNQNYAVLRQWENANNSAYNGLQVVVKKQMSHGMLFNANYTWSHSIDNGSSWHDAATTAAGAAGGDGYSTDVNNPGLDRGNSVFDIRHRLVLNYVVDLPGQKLKGALGVVAGGWSWNGIWAFQTGPHWSPYAKETGVGLVSSDPTNFPNACVADTFDPTHCINVGGEWTLDGQPVPNGVDRPNSSMAGFQQARGVWPVGWPSFNFFSPTGTAPGSYSAAGFPTLTAPCLACVGTLGRNTFVGPGQWVTDMTLGKTFNFTERINLRFEASAFNVFNRANYLLATTGGGAHNSLDDPLFGAAAGTLNARNLQLGLKLRF